MAARPVVLVHGYSDTGEGFSVWRDALCMGGYKPEEVSVCSYISLNNEMSIHDIAEGFNRALGRRLPIEQVPEFDAIVHSTGMLVVRAWLTLYPEQRGRLKHLVGLAPASFGSPLAHEGRSFIGALVKGNKDVTAPDFLQSGDKVLDALELGSVFTWDLAHRDLIDLAPDGQTYYGKDASTPYVFIFCGDTEYTGLREFVDTPGTDGTVRLAGCALNTRKIIVDLRTNPTIRDQDRLRVMPWSNHEIPVHIVPGFTHGSIRSAPGQDLIDLVADALKISDAPGYDAWVAAATQHMRDPDSMQQQYQQFIVHATDERGDGITDYNLQILRSNEDGSARVQEFTTDPHAYSSDPSYRCFHVDVKDLRGINPAELSFQITASSGSQLVGYRAVAASDSAAPDELVATMSLDNFVQYQKLNNPNEDPIQLFFPFTTTLIELRLMREARPFDVTQPNGICWFPDKDPMPLIAYSLGSVVGRGIEGLEDEASQALDSVAGFTPDQAAQAKQTFIGLLRKHFS